jgi:hypothetical protein
MLSDSKWRRWIPVIENSNGDFEGIDAVIEGFIYWTIGKLDWCIHSNDFDRYR